MGYDMYWKTRPEAVKQAYEEARQRFQKAADIRDKAKDALGEEDAKLYAELHWARIKRADAPMPEDASEALKETVRCQDEVYRLSDEMYAAEAYYFRLNIWGMGLCREIMMERGMLDDRGEEHPPFPKEKDFAVSKELFEEYYDDEDKREELLTKSPELKRWDEAYSAALGHEQEEIKGLPVYKLCSNDGWIVTPNEIKRAFAAHGTWVDENGDTLPKDDGQDVKWWPQWLAFLRGAIEHNGFQVY